jgi:hypothetical protein
LLVDGAVTRLLDAVVKGTDLSDDAKLLELGQQFEELWRHERHVEDALKSGNLSLDEQEQDSLLEEAAASTEAIANEILNTPVGSLAGFIVKARAVQWQQGTAEGILSGRYSDGMTIIVRDLLRLRGSGS